MNLNSNFDTYYKIPQCVITIYDISTARLITNYDTVLLQCTIARLSQFSTTVITIYDRRYNSRQNTPP